MTRLAILTQYYPPETGAPQARLHELAQRLSARGFEIQVLTALPNYPSGRIFEAYRGRVTMRESIDGIEVIRVPIYPSNSGRAVPRMVSYLSFVLSSLVFGAWSLRRPDITLVESPPLFLGVSGVLLSRLRRSRLVVNISDLWPESLVRLGALKEGPVLRALSALERWLYQRADLVSGQSHGIVDGIEKAVSTAQVAFAPNGCDTELFHPDRADRAYLDALGFGGRTIVGYAGLIGLAQGISVYVDMAARFRDRTDLAFVLVGDGPERVALEDRAQHEGLDNIVFLGRRPKPEMPGFVAGFDMSLVPLVTEIPGALPSKLYEVMASETAVILAAKGDARKLVESARAGLIVDYADPAAIADAIRQLADEPRSRAQFGRSGRAYAVAHHDRDLIAARFADRLTRLMEG